MIYAHICICICIYILLYIRLVADLERKLTVFESILRSRLQVEEVALHLYLCTTIAS